MSIGNYIYCFIRKDIPKAQQLIQLGHACYEAGNYQAIQNEPPNLVLFQVPDESSLKEVFEKLMNWNIEYSAFREPDINNQYTAICTDIISDPEDRDLFRNFKLYK